MSHVMKGSKKNFGYERNIPRCANCKFFADHGLRRDKKQHPRRFKCQLFGWNVLKVSCCDYWHDRKTGEAFDLENEESALEARLAEIRARKDGRAA